MPSRRTPLTLYFLLGAYAVCAQALLLREAQVVLLGSELAWGFIFTFWLVGVALGAAGVRHRARTADSARRWLAGAVLVLPLSLTAVLVFLRASRLIFGLGAGAYPGPGAVLLIDLLAALPVGIPIGAAFPTASAVLAEDAGDDTVRARSVGRIYAVEAAGSLVGGALFSFFLVARLDSFTLAIGLGTLLPAALLLLLAGEERHRTARFAAVALATLLAALTLLSLPARLDQLTGRWRWSSFAPGLELGLAADSRYQHIDIGRLENEYSLYLNGQVEATWPDPVAHAITAHFTACQHPDPKRILLLGGGQEGLVAELLRHHPVEVELVTLDEQAFTAQSRFLEADDLAALRSPAVRVRYGDIRYRVKRLAREGRAGWDLVILAAPEPATILSARLYTREFFAELERIMAPDGVLAFTLRGSTGYWGAEASAYVASIVEPLRTVFTDVLVTFAYPTDIFAARREGMLTRQGSGLARRYNEREIDSAHFDPLWFTGATDMFDPAKRAVVDQALHTHTPDRVNTDDHPVATLYHHRLWFATARGAHAAGQAPPMRGQGLVGFVLGLRPVPIALLILALTLAVGFVGLRRVDPVPVRTAVLWSTASVGCFSMAVEIILLYAFQVLFGYVYRMIGLIVGIFMAGLVIGSLLANRALSTGFPGQAAGEARTGSEAVRRGLRGMMVLDSAAALFALLLALLLPWLRSASAASLVGETAIFGLVGAAGVLGGALFPMAARVGLGTGFGTAEAAGRVAWADHLGGAAGALLTGTVLVPVVGTGAACVLLAVGLIAAAGLTGITLVKRGPAPGSISPG